MSSPNERVEQVVRLFLRHQPVLRAFIYSLVRHPSDTDDLLQDLGVFVLGRADEAPVEPTEFIPWCRAVARNRVMHHWRSHRRFQDVPSERLIELVERAYAETAPAPELVSARQRALAGCMEQLEASMKTMLRLRYVEGLTSEEIGRRMNRSAAAVRMALMRVRDLLTRCLDRRNDATGGASP